MENIYPNDYPYGTFPTQYTKQGKQEMLNKWKENANNQNLDEPITTTQSTQPQNSLLGNMDLSKILPLLKNFGNKNSTQNDMVSMLLPLLSKGNNMPEMSELIKNFMDKPIVEEDLSQVNIASNTKPIDSYKKVEV